MDKADQIPRRRFLQGLGASAMVSALNTQASTHMPADVIVGAVDNNVVIDPTGGEVRFPSGETCYVVANPKSDLDRRMLGKLTSYLEATLRNKTQIVKHLLDVPPKNSLILVAYSSEELAQGMNVPDDSPESFVLLTGKCSDRPVVAALASTDRGLKRAIQRLIISSRQHKDGLEIPGCRLSERPWIPEREYTVCSWVPRYVRGVFVNPYADERMNIWGYSGDQLSAYVEMYDWFGFSGVQLMEACYNYALFGSVEAAQSHLKEFASAARNNGQNVSLWVWAAEFSQFGWIDPEAAYTPANGNSAFQDPKVRRTFEKYYDYYANHARYVDRLIGHFYDPGRLTNQTDVFNYMRLLESKFRAKNPHIQMAIDMWAAKPGYFSELVDNGFEHYLILEQPHWLKPGQREALHEEAKRRRLKVGLWGWDTTECETDQLPSMYVNCGVLKNYYQEIKNGAASVYPYRYWSELEGNHLHNIYSEYVASQLLWNPDRDPHEILRELTDGIWGPANGDKVYAALTLIEDARSGPSWNTFWPQEPTYQLRREDPSYLQRAESAISALESIELDASFVPKFPLPFPANTLVELMLPHLRQIRAFAQFRIDLASVRHKATTGTSKDEIARLLAEIWKPIPEYTTWIGTYGQIERRMQEILVLECAADTGVEVKAPGWLRSEDAHRLLEKIQNVQRTRHEEWQFKARGRNPNVYLNEFGWPQNKLQDRLDSLIEEGCLEKLSEDTYRLVNWNDYAC